MPIDDVDIENMAATFATPDADGSTGASDETELASPFSKRLEGFIEYGVSLLRKGVVIFDGCSLNPSMLHIETLVFHTATFPQQRASR